MSSACEVDIAGVVGMHALRLASETPSALLDWNNNYGDDPEQGRLLPLQQFAQAFLCRHEDGFPGDHRRYRGQAQHLRYRRRQSQSGSHELLPHSRPTTAPAASAAMSAMAASPTIRCSPSAARALWKSLVSKTCCASSASVVSNTTPRLISRPFPISSMKPLPNI